MRAANRDERALAQVRKQYPDMTMEEMLHQRHLAADNIRKQMAARGFILPDDDDELWAIVHAGLTRDS